MSKQKTKHITPCRVVNLHVKIVLSGAHNYSPFYSYNWLIASYNLIEVILFTLVAEVISSHGHIKGRKYLG